MKKFFLGLFFVLLFTLTFAAECSFSSTSAKEFNLAFLVKNDFVSDVRLTLVVPYAEECLRAQGVSGNSFECSESMLPANDAFFKSLGFFSGKGVCNAVYGNGLLTVEFSTQTDMLVNKLSNNNVEISFREWQPVDSANEASLKNTLTIKIPDGAKLTSFYPMADPNGKADFDKGIVVWDPIPSSNKKPSVKFAIQDNSFTLFAGVLVLVVILAGAGFVILNKQKSSSTLVQAKTIKAKMVVLEQDFMKGKMDETTYRRLMEQYQIQLTELKVELAKNKPKES
ncbi:MAG: hypothetical protein WCW44_02340 [archaeon]|jgi:hypothetical protein